MAKRSTTDLQIPLFVQTSQHLADFRAKDKGINTFVISPPLVTTPGHGLGFLMCMFSFSASPKLFSLEMFQQYTANVLPMWDSSGKFCNLRKHLGHLAGVSVDLQTGDQKHTVNIFVLGQKELHDLCN